MPSDSTPTPPPLDVLQRWMQAVLMHPAGAERGLEAPAAQAELPLDGAQLNAVVAPSTALTSVERLDIYARAYFARLLECLRAEFPMFVRAVGEEPFTELAVGYLQRHPSRSYTLARLGEHFPRYLTETRPPSSTGDGDWPTLLIELAELEWAVGQVFDGPGAEGLGEPDFASLNSLSAAEFARTRLVFNPSLLLLAFTHPLNDWWESLRRGGESPAPPMQPSWLALNRISYVVRRHPLEELEFRLLRGLHAGAPVGEAIRDVAAISGVDVAALAARLAAWFRAWGERRFLLAVEPA